MLCALIFVLGSPSNAENIAAVAESVFEAPSTSIHRRAQQLNIVETFGDIIEILV